MGSTTPHVTIARHSGAGAQARAWCDSQPSQQCTAKSFIAYLQKRRHGELLTLHAISAFGKVALTKLTPAQVEALYARKLGDGLAHATARQFHVILHYALKDALRKGLVQGNITDQVDAPRAPRLEMPSFTTDQAVTFLNAVRGDRLEALYILALSTGMREGEPLGLKWRDVDLDAGALHVQSTLHYDKDGFTFSEPKTAQGRRRIGLPPFAVATLRAHRARQDQERLALGEAWDDAGLVFTDEAGGPLKAVSVLRGHFYPLLQQAGLPRIRFHDLRHTAASLLMAWKVGAKHVQGVLGHSNVTITLGTYSHVMSDQQDDAAEAMQRHFGHLYR